jgi:YidC/Oxa1 family membrane protein insertase
MRHPHHMPDQRNIILAVVLSIAVIMGFHFLYEKPRLEAIQAQKAADARMMETEAAKAATAEGTDNPDLPTPGESAATPTAETEISRDEALNGHTARVRIDTPRLHGSINLKGGRLDDLTLADYHQTVDRDKEVELLSPAGTQYPYYTEMGWLADGKGVAVPGSDAEWQVVGGGDARLTVSDPVTLRWENGDGLVFERKISVDKDFMFTVEQRVTNNGEAPVTLYPYSLAARRNLPEHKAFFILHEGPLGVFNGTLTERSYGNLAKDARKTADQALIETYSSEGGWIGITDKYWLVSLVPEPGAKIKGRITYRQDRNQYQVDLLGEAATIEPGAATTVTSYIFAGAKEVQLLDRYGEALGITRFDRAVDFGWFYFLTKPFFFALDFLGKAIGNFGVAILVFTVFLKALLFPLANKSYKSMSKLRQLQPQVTALREKYNDDKARLQQEMMKLYKDEGVNPLSGCLPIFVQIPIFFALYKVLFVTIEMRHAPFFGWIQDLSVPDPTSVVNLFGLLPFEAPTLLHLGVWPLIMGVTMFLQMRLNPTPPDPVQQKMFMFMPIIFTFLLASFPAGLVIYWTWNNTLSIIQQSIIMHRMGVKVSFFNKDPA